MTWDVRDKTVLVTGATGGIGLEASVQLARLGAHVVLVGRDPASTNSVYSASPGGSATRGTTSPRERRRSTLSFCRCL
jgi:NAD(P)-dependent dehydrogenase (short-subunit alcohol dehydrogenase family)